MKDLVSVIIPCYNDGMYIKDSISSVINQSYKNLEIIIVDDGSSDIETKNILKTISNDKIRVFFIANKGPAYARNFAIQKSNGEFILPLDADDKIDVSYVEKAVTILKKNSNVGIVYCKAYFFGEKFGPWNLPEYSLKNMLLDNVIFVTAMFRKMDWKIVDGFCCELKYGLEDYDFWLSILEMGREVVQIQETLFYYRIKKKSRSKNFSHGFNQIRETYALIFARHKIFYINNIDDYNEVMRNKIIFLLG
jgi:glycosyltransferase involved in cell wall biosynthesis